jgi:hypothetical protein
MSRQAWNACIPLCLFTVVVSCPIDVRAQSIPPEIPTNGLVGWWPFSGNANDESGGGNHGTVYGATLVNDRYGVNTSAYSFDGVNDYIAFANAINFGVGSFTISLHCLARDWGGTQADGYSYIFGSPLTGGTNDQGFRVACAPNYPAVGRAAFQTCIGDAGQNDYFLYSSEGSSLNQWYCLTAVLDRATMQYRYYVNGVLVATVNIPAGYGSPDLGYSPSVGSFRMDNWIAHYFNGVIDDIAIWNRALTATEIEGIARASTSIPMRSDTLALGSYGSSTKIVGPSSGSYQYALPSVSGTLATSQTDPLPFGTVFMYASATPPAGYLECNGQIVSRSTYAGLFAVVGTSYGAGNGSTTFAVPTLTHPVLRYGIRAQ